MRGSSSNVKFSYEVSFSESSCTAIKENQAMDYIKLGRKGDSFINPGDFKAWLIRFEIPETSPLCMIRYNIEVKADNQHYISENFDVNIVS